MNYQRTKEKIEIQKENKTLQEKDENPEIKKMKDD